MTFFADGSCPAIELCWTLCGPEGNGIEFKVSYSLGLFVTDIGWLNRSDSWEKSQAVAMKLSRYRK